MHRWFAVAAFPHGTLVVNLVGCLLIGFLNGLAASRGLISSQARLFLLIGLLGSFTTFSTFGYETLMLIENSDRASAVVNVLVSVVVGLAAVWIGQSLSRVL